MNINKIMNKDPDDLIECFAGEIQDLVESKNKTIDELIDKRITLENALYAISVLFFTGGSDGETAIKIVNMINEVLEVTGFAKKEVK